MLWEAGPPKFEPKKPPVDVEVGAVGAVPNSPLVEEVVVGAAPNRPPLEGAAVVVVVDVPGAGPKEKGAADVVAVFPKLKGAAVVVDMPVNSEGADDAGVELVAKRPDCN